MHHSHKPLRPNLGYHNGPPGRPGHSSCTSTRDNDNAPSEGSRGDGVYFSNAYTSSLTSSDTTYLSTSKTKRYPQSTIPLPVAAAVHGPSGTRRANNGRGCAMARRVVCLCRSDLHQPASIRDHITRFLTWRFSATIPWVGGTRSFRDNSHITHTHVTSSGLNESSLTNDLTA